MTEPDTGGRSKPHRVTWLPLAAVVALVLVVAGGFLLARGRGGTEAATGSASAAPASSPTKQAGPRLAVDRETVDFGQVKFNQRVKAEFVVSNAGNEPLQIMGQPVVRVVEGC